MFKSTYNAEPYHIISNCHLSFFFRVNSSKSLFDTVPPCTDTTCENTELELNMDRCNCEKIGGVINVNCQLEIMQFNNMPGEFEDRTGATEEGNRKKRELVYSDDIIYVYDDEEPGQNMYLPRSKRAVQTKMSLDNATEYCRKRILDTAAAKVCLELTGVNVSSAIQSCAADLQVSINNRVRLHNLWNRYCEGDAVGAHGILYRVVWVQALAGVIHCLILGQNTKLSQY